MKLLILALDGFDPDLFSRWREQLPNLSALAQAGTWSPIASTIPPMTYPAWSTFLTGVNPAQHGIFDFTERLPGTLLLRFLNATRRRFPTFLKLASDQGMRVGSIGLPTTYPPESLSGYQISGFDTPLPSKAGLSHIYPLELARHIERQLGGFYFGNFNEGRIGRGWHRRVLTKLLAGIQRKLELVRFLHQTVQVDLLLLHIGETDTVGHHFWSFCDGRSPRHVPANDAALSHAIQNVYGAADDLAGQVLSLTEPETVIVISDHGMGGTSDRMLYLNRYLAEKGLLAFSPAAFQSRWAGALKTRGMKWLPYRIQQQAFKVAGGSLAALMESRQRFGGLDWSKTVAYSEELNYFPAIYLNQAGREPFGIVQLEQVDGTIARIRKALLDWRDPQDGAPIIRQVFLREEVFQGSEIGYAPDLILDLNLPQGYSYALGRSTSAAGAKSWRNLLSEEYLGAKGNSMNGAHRRQGTFLVNRSGSDFAIPADFNLAQMAPMILNMLGMDVPAWMSKQPESKEVNAIEPALAPELSFTPTEEADLRKNLLDLGYLS